MNLVQTYTYEDIGLAPTKCSEIASRDDVDVSIRFHGYSISLPIILAPMSSVVGLEMCWALDQVDGIACLPRTSTWVKDEKLWRTTEGIPSISAKNVEQFINSKSHDNEAVCIDVANGFSTLIGAAIKKLKKYNSNIFIITGNVGSLEGYKYLKECRADAVRVGIGNGAGCSTSIATGVGQGQATLIREVAEYKEAYDGPTLIADGGIKTAGDIIKSIALGADIVMTGRLFAGCKESPGPVVKFNNKLYKQYAGQASFAVKKSNKYVEGDDTLCPYSGTLTEMWHKLEDGIRSAMAYMNCKTIEELRFLPEENFRLLSPGAKIERTVHANL